MLALARQVPAADRAMKDARWEKSRLVGTELRGKTLAIVGFGRIGQELARRAQAFEMRVVAHDPFIADEVAAAAGVELVTLDEACAAADYLSLHLPVTDRTRTLFDAGRFAICKRGIRIVNTARGELIDEPALAAAILSGAVGGAALDVFAIEPPSDWALARLPQVIATPHLAGSTEEAQEFVGLETVTAVRDYLRDGIVRNAVNFPSIAAGDLPRLLPWIRLAERLATLAALVSGPARVMSLGVRYYGTIADSPASSVLAASAAAGLLRPILSSGVSMVNARDVARARGIDIVESRSTRERPYTSLLSIKIRSDRGETWLEGTVLEPSAPRLVSIEGIAVEAPLAGTIIVVANDDRPGVIGEVGTILGRHAINIANFALGRSGGGAIGIVNVDAEAGEALNAVVVDIKSAAGVRDVWVAAL
jgi:D-3-phosphoglycerate dehydrogenase